MSLVTSVSLDIRISSSAALANLEGLWNTGTINVLTSIEFWAYQKRVMVYQRYSPRPFCGRYIGEKNKAASRSSKKRARMAQLVWRLQDSD